jgi:alpha-beta hydrolase superfamily lysophospholipase
MFLKHHTITIGGGMMAGLPEKTGSFMGSDGVRIFFRQFQADPERARMVIAHGLGEHSGRYGNVVEQMLLQGVSIWALDHRGHGRSEGKRGHVLNFSQYANDLRLLVQLARTDLPEGMKCFLLGHSLGGLIALDFIRQNSDLVDGVIASSPALGMAIAVPRAKKALGIIMSSVWPGLTMNNELDASKISHDPHVVKAYEDDPLVHDRVSARFFTEFLATMETVRQTAATLKTPLLLQVAGDDHLVNSQSSRDFFEVLTLEDKTMVVYTGMYHEIYNEPREQRQKVLTDLVNWVVNRMG